MKKLTIICRTECVDPVVRTLRAANAPRLTVSHVHALGSGVDPEHYRLGFEEGGAYTEKAKIEVICPVERVGPLIDVVRRHARTGSRGDGVVIVSCVDRVVKIRTGTEDGRALL